MLHVCDVVMADSYRWEGVCRAALAAWRSATTEARTWRTGVFRQVFAAARVRQAASAAVRRAGVMQAARSVGEMRVALAVWRSRVEASMIHAKRRTPLMRQVLLAWCWTAGDMRARREDALRRFFLAVRRWQAARAAVRGARVMQTTRRAAQVRQAFAAWHLSYSAGSYVRREVRIAAPLTPHGLGKRWRRGREKAAVRIQKAARGLLVRRTWLRSRAQLEKAARQRAEQAHAQLSHQLCAMRKEVQGVVSQVAQARQRLLTQLRQEQTARERAEQTVVKLEANKEASGRQLVSTQTEATQTEAALEPPPRDNRALIIEGARRALDSYEGQRRWRLEAASRRAPTAPCISVWVPRRTGGRQRAQARACRQAPWVARRTGGRQRRKKAAHLRAAFVGGERAQHAFMEAAAAYGIAVGAADCQALA